MSTTPDAQPSTTTAQGTDEGDWLAGATCNPSAPEECEECEACQ